MPLLHGVNLLPASGEWVYDPLPHRARQASQATPTVQNLWLHPDGTRTDYSAALDQLQAEHPELTTVGLVVAWFGSSTDAAACRVYPSTVFIGGDADVLAADGSWQPDPWRCSGLTPLSPGLIPISQNGGSFTYGGTPADGAVVRCLRDLRARGLRTMFYPFILMDCLGYPWRGRIALTGADNSTAASDAAAHFLGSAQPGLFTRDAAAATVGYAGAPTDWTYRRMILHYANLCVVAGGVDLFLIGSELRGLEAMRGPAWTPAGTADPNGRATWDYPFVAGLVQLANDVRGVFDAAGLARDGAAKRNLVTYAADWSVWTGVQHAGADGAAFGQWPHLDALYASPAIDLVSLDDYLPLSDWTTGDGGRDARGWSAPAPSGWPPDAASLDGLGLDGPPALHDSRYLKANIEGGEHFCWYYNDGGNAVRGGDPDGSDLQLSVPVGDRLAQLRRPYAPGQEILGRKQLRWWWHNSHRALYDAGDGQGFVAHGPPTAWVPQSKSITFAEYGFPTVDRATNQPNVFFDPKSVESFTPYWSVWGAADGGGWRPRPDDALAALALQAVYEYWTLDGYNETATSGVPLIDTTFMCAWNWDARPFPAFPALVTVWGDCGNYRAGTWIGGKGPALPGAALDPVASPPAPPLFPTLVGQGWPARWRPLDVGRTASHVSGRETRLGRRATTTWRIELPFPVLPDEGSADYHALAGFFAARAGSTDPFALATPAGLGLGPTVLCRFADDVADFESFMEGLWQTGAIVMVSVPA